MSLFTSRVLAYISLQQIQIHYAWGKSDRAVTLAPMTGTSVTLTDARHFSILKKKSMLFIRNFMFHSSWQAIDLFLK